MKKALTSYERILTTLRDCFRDVNRPFMIHESIDLVEELLEPHRLARKYDGPQRPEHPEYLIVDWQFAVEDSETLLGYWEWVAGQISLEQS